MGLEKELVQVAEPIRGIRAKDIYSNQLFSVDVNSLVESGKCGPCYSIMRDSLQELLFNAVGKAQIISGKSVERVVDDGK